MRATVIGAGLAGSEAAFQLATRGVAVTLWEMRPVKMTPAHRTGRFAELVCSNSLRSQSLENAAGLLKEEMRRAGSLVMAAAARASVPAGSALAVDRALFSTHIEETLAALPRVEIVRGEVAELPPPAEGEAVVLATGPLTSDALAESVRSVVGEEHLAFFDAIAPIVSAESIDRSIVFKQSRHGEPADGDYWNCPMDRDGYRAFWEALVAAEKAPLHDFEKDIPFFEGCLPVEEMARRGEDTLRFGPLRPIGLTDPRTGRRPWAVVQLRQDDIAGDHLNLVGFQTNLTFPEQDRVFRTIPGLANAELVRHGTIHRNSYLNAPRLLTATFQLRARPRTFVAGQLSGVEGYIESAASGMMAGIHAATVLAGAEPVAPPRETVLGSLAHYLANADARHFVPSKAAFGLMPDLGTGVRGKGERRRAQAERALAAISPWLAIIGAERARAVLAA
ncbi:MAG: methylenetetrahydrofolate--tRNA-(uracil(54)-C(5))-methyltransferase (FADH(2)-oxidizing) TrmFO [Acidobacteriota bacterium]